MINDPENDSNNEPPYWLAFIAFYIGIATAMLMEFVKDVHQWFRRL